MKKLILKQYKNLLKLNQEQKNIIVGTLLGDSSIPCYNWKPTINPYIKFEQGYKNKEYLYHLYKFFHGNWATNKPKKRYIIINGNTSIKSWYFRLYSHQSLRFYRDLFYDKKTKKKKVPKLIHRWLNPQSLAFWYMDDGSYSRSGMYLHTQSFILSDQKILIKALKDNFKINANINKDKIYYKIYIKSDSRIRFINIIKPYIIKNMRYKLKINNK